MPSSGRLLAAEYERARQAAEELRQSLRDSGATSLARLVRAVGCSVEFMPLQQEEVALLSQLVRLPDRATFQPPPAGFAA